MLNFKKNNSYLFLVNIEIILSPHSLRIFQVCLVFEKILRSITSQIITMVWSLTYSQTSWNVKSGGPYKASLRTKLVEVMEFQMSYFKSWKMMLWKCCTQYASKFGKLSSGHRTGKGQFSFQSQRKAMPKNAQTTAQLHSSHTLVK